MIKPDLGYALPMTKGNGKRVKRQKPAPITGPHDSNAHFRELNKIIDSWGK